MKITFIGTGNMSSTTRCNTSLLVDNILFDLGMGTIKQIERLKVYTKSIQYVCISHYHSDHFFDIPNLLIGRERRNEQTITFFGAIGLKQKIIDLMKLSHADGNEHKYDKIEEKYNIRFVELKEGEQYQEDNFSITSIRLKHGNCYPAYGYLLEKENHKIAYCCDTTLFDEFYDICQNVNYMFSEVNGLKTDAMHTGLEDYRVVANRFKNCQFYALHRSDYPTDNTIENLHFPMDGDVLEI